MFVDLRLKNNVNVLINSIVSYSPTISENTSIHQINKEKKRKKTSIHQFTNRFTYLFLYPHPFINDNPIF